MPQEKRGSDGFLSSQAAELTGVLGAEWPSSHGPEVKPAAARGAGFFHPSCRLGLREGRGLRGSFLHRKKTDPFDTTCWRRTSWVRGTAALRTSMPLRGDVASRGRKDHTVSCPKTTLSPVD